jgi:hypothetical protein
MSNIAESRVGGKDYDGILGWIDELRKEILIKFSFEDEK